MSKLEMEVNTSLPPERVRDALLDFSDRRPDIWPGLDRSLYEVYSVGPTTADIKEGSSFPGMRVWAREHYDWSEPDTVRWTVQESNFSSVGSFVLVTLHPREEWRHPDPDRLEQDGVDVHGPRCGPHDRVDKGQADHGLGGEGSSGAGAGSVGHRVAIGEGPMEYRTLGSTGVRVSTHCLGAMMFGAWGNRDVDECVRIVHAAIDGGVNFVDTADVYSAGESEEIVGRALKGRRDDVVLATKVHGSMGPGMNEQGNSRLWIMREVENSLRRLGTDHIDLYQIHRPEGETDVEETLGALTDLQRQGTIRYFGSSTFPGWQVVEAQWVAERRGLSRFRTEQPPYSIFVRAIEHDVLPVAQRYGMGVLVWAPLARGWLTGRYRRESFDDSPESRSSRTKERAAPIAAQFDRSRPEIDRKLDLVEELMKVAADAGLSMTHMAVAFVLAHPAVTSAIVGPRTIDQLNDLLMGADARLGADALDAIDRLVPPGTNVDDNDRGFTPRWFEPSKRRR